MNKKFLAKLLIFCMIFTMLPMTAFGAETATADTTTYTVAVDANPTTIMVDETSTVSVKSVTYKVGNDTKTVPTAEYTTTFAVTDGTDYATISGATVTGKAAGEATVTATVTLNGKTYTGTAKVTVTAKGEEPAKTYNVTIAEMTNGTVTADKTTEVKAGETVTLTVTPAENYALAKVTVTDADKKEVATTAGENGKYTFAMPASDVTVTATFDQLAVVEKPADTTGTTTTEVTGVINADAIANNEALSVADNKLTVDQTTQAGTATGAEVAIDSTTVDSLITVVEGTEVKAEAVVVATDVADIEMDGAVLKAAAAALADNTTAAEKATLKLNVAPADVKAEEGNTVKAFDVKVDVVVGNKVVNVMDKANNLNLTLTFKDVTEFANVTADVFAFYFDENGKNLGKIGKATRDGNNFTVAVKHLTVVGLSATDLGYTLTYTPGEGKGEEQTYNVTADVKVKSYNELKFTAPEGKVFDVWSGSDGKTYKANDTLKVADLTDNITLTATWKKSSGVITGNGGGGGGGSTSNVSIATKVTGGKVTVSPSRPTRGQTVTLTVKPADGYKLDTITVTDSKGNTIELTKVADNKYTFTMPAGKVTVTPTFVKVDGSDQKDDNKTNVDKRFSDVASDAWYAEYINYVAENGLMNGYENGAFGPNDKTTRAQIVTVLYRLEGEPAVQNANSFKDVSAGGQYYSAPVAWAARNNIVNGYEDGRFGPNDNVTREQISTILYRYAAYKQFDTTLTGDITTFSDAAKVSGWAKTAISWAVGEGLMNGDNGALRPQGNATRAEIAALLMRFSENIAK